MMSEIKAKHEFPGGQRLSIVHGDITQERVDAIVNAANRYLAHGGGVAAAISRRGGPEIQRQSDEWVAQHGPVPTGGAALTGPGMLPCKAVIHAVGPVWHGGQHGEEDQLRAAARSSLELAHQQGFQSLALPAISAGIFGFPKDRCARILLGSVREFIEQNPDSPLRDARFILFDQPTLEAFQTEFQRQFGV